MTIFKIWCEYDIDQDYHVFATEEAAKRFIQEAPLDGETYESLDESGLIGIDEIGVVE